MSQRLIKDHNVEALKVAASWPGADRATLVTLATVLAATGADHDGLTYFEALAASQPDQVLPLALAGYFQVRDGADTPAGVARLDDAASRDLGLAQYYRGLALAALPAEAGHAGQAVADLEFVLAVRDQFPGNMIRAVYHGLAAAYAALGQDDLAAKAVADSGLSPAPAGARLQFGGGWADPADGFRFSSPRIAGVAPGVRVAQGHDFADFGFVSTGSGIVAIDAGTAGRRVRAALADAGLHADDVSHVILTHAHFDHAGGIGALTGPGTQVIAQAGFPSELQRQHAHVVPFRYFTGSRAGFGGGDRVQDPGVNWRSTIQKRCKLHESAMRKPPRFQALYTCASKVRCCDDPLSLPQYPAAFTMPGAVGSRRAKITARLPVSCCEGGASVIAVVVPAFNEADRLRTLLPRIPACLFGAPVQVIVVSDGSADGTEAVALDHGAVLVRLPKRRGKGAALRAGFAQAMELDPAQLVTMDADGQHDPADLEQLVQPVMAKECALAVGSRFLSAPSRGPAPLNRYLVRKALVAALRATLGRTYTDPCCGYRCFSSQALQAIRLQGDHYQSELETLFEAAIHGLSVVEVPVRADYPPGCSKMGARFGRLAGRAWVIGQYVSTIARKARELRRADAIALSSVDPSAWGGIGRENA